MTAEKMLRMFLAEAKEAARERITISVYRAKPSLTLAAKALLMSMTLNGIFALLAAACAQRSSSSDELMQTWRAVQS